MADLSNYAGRYGAILIPAPPLEGVEATRRDHYPARASAQKPSVLNRADDVITANTLLRADWRNNDDAVSPEEVRDRLQFLADTGRDLRDNLPI